MTKRYTFDKKCEICKRIYFTNVISQAQYENLADNINIEFDIDENHCSAIITSKCESCCNADVTVVQPSLLKEFKKIVPPVKERSTPHVYEIFSEMHNHYLLAKEFGMKLKVSELKLGMHNYLEQFPVVERDVILSVTKIIESFCSNGGYPLTDGYLTEFEIKKSGQIINKMLDASEEDEFDSMVECYLEMAKLKVKLFRRLKNKKK